MATVGVRELKSKLSYYLSLARRGERVVVTERGVPIAELSPITQKTTEEVLRDLVARGLVSWSGGKPKGASPPARITGKPLSEIVLEDRG